MTFVTYKTDPTQMAFIVGRRWHMFACKVPNRKVPGDFVFMYVGAKGWVKLHGLEHPIVPVLVEEILGDRYAPEVTNYGWEDLGRLPGDEKHDDRPSMIQLRAGLIPEDQRPERATMLLQMCFAYGFEIEEQNGAGRVYALRITEVATVTGTCGRGCAADAKWYIPRLRENLCHDCYAELLRCKAIDFRGVGDADEVVMQRVTEWMRTELK